MGLNVSSQNMPTSACEEYTQLLSNLSIHSPLITPHYNQKNVKPSVLTENTKNRHTHTYTQKVFNTIITMINTQSDMQTP